MNHSARDNPYKAYLPCPKFFKAGLFNKPIERFEGKDLAPCGDDHFLHVFPTDPEAASADAGDDFIFRRVFGSSCQAQFAEVLDSGTLSLAVPSSSVIFASIIICGLNSLGTMKSGV